MEIRAREGARQKGIEVFCCYAREDQPLLVQLQKHLKPLQHEGLITLWADIDIDAGTEWEKEIHRHLNTAQIILLLISPDFMASEYCYSVEMQRAIERHEHGEARVIPIILRPVAWQKTPLGKLQALPKDASPITSGKWHHQDEAFYDVAEGIRDAVEARLAEVEQARLVEEEKERARLAEEERVRKAEEERLRRAAAAEQARLDEEERVRKNREEEQARKAEEERARKTRIEERLRKVGEEQVRKMREEEQASKAEEEQVRLRQAAAEQARQAEEAEQARVHKAQKEEWPSARRSNKYERDIEKILRDLERTESKPGLGQKLGNNVTLLRGGLFSRFWPRWNLLMLKWRYRKGTKARIVSSSPPHRVPILILRFVGACCLLIGVIFCLPFTHAGGLGVELGVPLGASGLVFVLPQNNKSLQIIEGVILFIVGSFAIGGLLDYYAGLGSKYNSNISLVFCRHYDYSNGYCIGASFVPMGVWGFFACIFALAIASFLFLRWTKIVGGAIMGSLFILVGIVWFAVSQSKSYDLHGLPNVFGVLYLLILLALGITTIVVPVVRRVRARP